MHVKGHFNYVYYLLPQSNSTMIVNWSFDKISIVDYRIMLIAALFDIKLDLV